MIRLQTTDPGVIDTFNRLIATGEDPSGYMMAIGEVLLEFTKERFVLSSDPYGIPWVENSDTTLRSKLHSNRKNFTKKGAVSALGAKVLAGKKPLIGDTKDLSTQFSYTVIGNDLVTLTSLMPYAAMQNYGGTKAEFPHLWGDIPARQIFPDEARGLPDELQGGILDVLRGGLQKSWDGG
jgi:hypothetical protein